MLNFTDLYNTLLKTIRGYNEFGTEKNEIDNIYNKNVRKEDYNVYKVGNMGSQLYYQQF